MPRKLCLVATVAGLALTAGAMTTAATRANAQTNPAQQSIGTGEQTVADQRKRRKSGSKRRQGSPPRGSKAGSNSGE